MIRGRAVLLALAAGLAAGCVGYRDYCDPDADRYEAVLRQTSPRASGKRARVTVSVRESVAGDAVPPPPAVEKAFRAAARQAVLAMKLFEPGDVGAAIEQPDYHFLFDVRIETTDEPGALSGLLWPFFRSRETIVRLRVLDGRGRPLARYAASVQTSMVRHPLLVLFAPFYPPASAERQARRGLFRALAVKLIRDRESFL